MLKQSSRTFFMLAFSPSFSFHGFQQLREKQIEKALWFLALQRAPEIQAKPSASQAATFLPLPQRDVALDKDTLLLNRVERTTLNALMRDKNCPLTLNEALREIHTLHNRFQNDITYILVFEKYYSAGVRAPHILAIESLEALYPTNERKKHPLFEEFKQHLDQGMAPEKAITRMTCAYRKDDPELQGLFSRPFRNGITILRPTLEGLQEYYRFSD
jgi:hypothetical protein